MGLFKSKTKIYVSSVAYNLGGPIAERPDYLNTTIYRYVLENRRAEYLGNTILNSQLGGPTMDQRMFYRWALNNYPNGRMTGNVSTKENINADQVEPFIPFAPGETVEATLAFIDAGDIVYWAERHIAVSRHADFNTAWIAEYNSATTNMEITYTDLTVDIVPVPDFVDRADYIICYYNTTLTNGTIQGGVYIYRIGSGNATLDALDIFVAAKPEFFPVVPMRLANLSIRDPLYAADFPLYEKAYKKAGAGDINELLDELEANANIGDIDYAFLVHGVELNTAENVGKRYLYEFLRELIAYQSTSLADVVTFLNFTAVLAAAVAAQATWTAAQSDPLDPLFGTPKPGLPVKKSPNMSVLKVNTNATLNYDVRLNWLTIEENVFAGLGQVGAKSGDLWWTKTAPIGVPSSTIFLQNAGAAVGAGTLEVATLYWQDSATTFRTLTVYGMDHETFVYAGQAAAVSLHEALDDPDETSFIVPLHYPTLCQLPVVIANQLATSNRLMVFNCYVVKKIRWYQRGIFKAILAIVLTAVFFPAGVGVLGANVSVGMAFGFTGVTAVLAGALANALVSMVIVSIINVAATAVFGDKLGAIIGTIASFFVMSAAANFGQTGSFSINWSQFMRADNLLRLTDSVVQGITKVAQISIEEIQGKMANKESDYNKTMREIEKKTQELLGYSGTVIDPLMFTNEVDISVQATESRQAFLNRTLLTGSDITEMSFTMIYDFPRLTLDLSNIGTG